MKVSAEMGRYFLDLNDRGISERGIASMYKKKGLSHTTVHRAIVKARAIRDALKEDDDDSPVPSPRDSTTGRTGRVTRAKRKSSNAESRK